MDGPVPDLADDLLAPARAGEATAVLPDGVFRVRLAIAEGRIVEVERGTPVPEEAWFDGRDLLLPGAVDLHTDHVEKHLFPRAGVRWDPLAALLAHDAQATGAGITTVFDGLAVGASLRNPERREILGPLLEALERAGEDGLFRAEHLVHLRCEVCDPETPELTAETIDRPRVRLVSVMDHTPGDRQSPDVARWTARMAADLGLDPGEAEARTEALLARSARVSAAVRAEVTAAARARGLPLMSHDDASAAHVAAAAAEGAAISEFPTTVEAARAARPAGLAVVAGAPNYLRGGSQSGNVAVRALLEAGLVDALASDYVPRSLLDAAVAIAADPALDLPLQIGRAHV